MKTYANKIYKLMTVPDDRVAVMNEIAHTDGIKPLFITFINPVPDYPYGSVVYEENKEIGATVANVVAGNGQSISSDAALVAFEDLISQVKAMKKDDRFNTYYFVGNFSKNLATNMVLFFQSIMMRENICPSDEGSIICEVEAVDHWSLDNDDDDKPKKKDKKKKKKKK